MVEFLKSIKGTLFVLDLAVHYVLLFGIVWSVAFPNKRIWPPPKKRSWHYAITWVLFYAAFILNASLILLDWNRWFFTHNFRFFLGIPIAVIGSLLVSWGIMNVGRLFRLTCVARCGESILFRRSNVRPGCASEVITLLGEVARMASG
ncbi:MAG: hypothetical protein MUP22_12130 [Desulfobacterales bacterium]|nr:hypothetical protein [Desulfobacterales bacterium]